MTVNLIIIVSPVDLEDGGTTMKAPADHVSDVYRAHALLSRNNNALSPRRRLSIVGGRKPNVPILELYLKR